MANHVLALLLLPLALAQLPTSCLRPDQSYFSQGLWYRPNPLGSFINQGRSNFPTACTVSARVSINPSSVSTDATQPIAVDSNGYVYYYDASAGIQGIQYPALPRLYLPTQSIPPTRIYAAGPNGLFFLVSGEAGAYVIAYSWSFPGSMMFNVSVDSSFRLGNCQANHSICTIDIIYPGYFYVSNAATGKVFVYDMQYGTIKSTAILPNGVRWTTVCYLFQEHLIALFIFYRVSSAISSLVGEFFFLPSCMISSVAYHSHSHGSPSRDRTLLARLPARRRHTSSSLRRPRTSMPSTSPPRRPPSCGPSRPRAAHSPA